MGNAFGWIKEPFEFIVNTVKDIIDLFVAGFKLVKELFFGGIVVVKALVDIFMSSIELLISLMELLEYISVLIDRYLYLPFLFAYLVPLFIASYFLVKFVNSIVSSL